MTGKINVKDKELDTMLKEALGPINFTMFLNMFGEKLSGKGQGARRPQVGEPTQCVCVCVSVCVVSS